MNRKALIIYCSDTSSGHLNGPDQDNTKYRDFLKSSVGGSWYDHEITSLKNPSVLDVKLHINHLLNDADYTFIIFSGHGCIYASNNQQHVELSDGDMSELQLKTDAPKQTLIIDSCRGIHKDFKEIIKGFSESMEMSIKNIGSTRKMFEDAVMKAEKGWTVLYAASADESAVDTPKGGAYLLSLLEVAEEWEKKNKSEMVLTLKNAHDKAKIYLQNNFTTIQIPTTNNEKRANFFPFAVKFGSLNS